MHDSHCLNDVSEGDLNTSDSRARFVSGLDSSRARELLDRDSRAFLHQSLSTPCMNALKTASQAELTDVEGRAILDFHGNSVHQIGYGHPRVIDAIQRQLAELPFCPRRFTNETAVRLAERLGELTGGVLPKVLLMPGGTLAIGAAMKLAMLATGRHKFVSFWGSFHGASLDAISVGGEHLFRSGLGPLLPGCEHIAPFTAGGRGNDDVLRIEAALAGGDVAALVAEPVRCTTVEIPPKDYWRRVRKTCEQHGTLLIFDEIPTALGRTGCMFAYEHFGVTPDILALGKGLGGGIFPQAALLARAELDVCQHTALGHYTHEKSPVGAAAAIATLDVIRDEGLVMRSHELGEWWRTQLRDRLTSVQAVREVRGLGLLVGIELRDKDPSRLREFADRVLYRCLERGLSYKVSEGRVLTLTPPLIVTHEQLTRATEILAGAIAGG